MGDERAKRGRSRSPRAKKKSSGSRKEKKTHKSKESRRKEDRKKHRSRSRSRDRRRRGDSSSGYSRSSSEDSRDRKRSRGDKDKDKRRDDGGSKPAVSASPAEGGDDGAAAEMTEEDRLEAERAAEQEKLQAEMEKRRKRIEAWQETRRKQQAEEEAAAMKKEEEERAKHKSWTLDGDDSDDDDMAPPSQAAAAEEEVDPLDAFMASNQKLSSASPQEPSGRMAAAVEEEEDPLDAFMAAEVMPEVQRLGVLPPMSEATTGAEGAERAADEGAKGTTAETAGERTEGGGDAAMGEAGDAGTAIEAAAAKSTNGIDVTMGEVATKAPVAESASPGGDADVEGESQGAELPTAPAAMTAAVTPAVMMMVKKHPEKKKKKLVKKKMRQRAKTANMRRGGLGMAGGQYADSSDEESEEGSEEDQEETEAEWKARALVGRLSKADKLDNMDKNIVYAPFRRNFYIEAAEIAKLDDAQVKALRSQLDGVKVRGKDAPKPIKSWNQCGLASRILDVIKKSGFDAPLPIQAQSLPSIMSGRDVIGIAKTGSGKTLAFVLPMLRHAKDQPPLKQGDGMIALIMAPTRELVGQIMRETKKFAKPMGMNVVAVYGGSGVAQQISELKRGTEIVVATPGRMIDILATGTGKITNLRRVTYLVLDEADRMFDMGFEPQIDRIIMNTRPDRQTVLFSATFPRQVELLAKKVLQSPIEIQVGGRSVVNPDIDQRIEIRSEEDQFLRLLELLGDWYEKGKVLVFVHSQDKCDSIFRDLLKSGYPCLSLHGGKDQLDREQTVADFKGNVCNLMIATSVAARGLDVKDLVLVVNYDVPNHYEDYVHRVGRTGRAGVKGTAITFITPEQDKYAPDLLRALTESGRPIPKDLQELADEFSRKRKEGLVMGHGTGYGGTGFKFDSEEAEARKKERKAAAAAAGLHEDEDDVFSSSEEEDVITKTGGVQPTVMNPMVQNNGIPGSQGGIPTGGSQALAVAAASAAAQTMLGVSPQQQLQRQALAAAAQAAAAQAAANQASQPAQPLHPVAEAARAAAAAATAAAAKQAQVQAAGMMAMANAMQATNPAMAAAQMAAAQQVIQQSQALVLREQQSQALMSPAHMSAAQEKAAMFAAQMNAKAQAAKQAAAEEHFQTQLEINDFPQHARWKVTHKDALNQISEFTGAAITTRGQFYPPGKEPPPGGEPKLHLLIEGPTEHTVRRAKQEIKTIIETTMANMTNLPGHRSGGFGGGGGRGGGGFAGGGVGNRYSVF